MQSFHRYDVAKGNAPDTYGTAITFIDQYAIAGVSRLADITVWDNPVEISWSYDGVTFGDDYEIDSDDQPVQLPVAIRAFTIRNKTAGLVGRYQVAAFW